MNIVMTLIKYNYEVQKLQVNGVYQTTTSSPNLTEAMQVAMHQAESTSTEHRVVRIPLAQGQTIAVFPAI